MLLSQSDYVVISTPHTPDTDRIIDADAIAAMKADSVVINVGRGKCIDEAALVQGQLGRHLLSGVISVIASASRDTWWLLFSSVVHFWVSSVAIGSALSTGHWAGQHLE